MDVQPSVRGASGAVPRLLLIFTIALLMAVTPFGAPGVARAGVADRGCDTGDVWTPDWRGTSGADTLLVDVPTFELSNPEISIDMRGGDDLICFAVLPEAFPGTVNTVKVELGGGDDVAIFLGRITSAELVINGMGGDDTIVAVPRDPTILSDNDYPNTFNGGSGFDRLLLAGCSVEIDMVRGIGQAISGTRSACGVPYLPDVPFLSRLLKITKVNPWIATATKWLVGEASDPGPGFRFSGFPAVYGSPYADVLRGGGENDFLNGMDGDDQLYGKGGSDRLYGGRGDDLLNPGWRGSTADVPERVDGGPGTDTFDVSHDYAASQTRPKFWPLSIDLVKSEAFEQSYTGGYEAGGGEVRAVENVRGTPLADEIFGSDGINRIWGGGGADVIHGRGGDDTLFGQPGDDDLRGGAGDDVIEGGWGDDNARGGPGNDVINVGEGHDDARGGDGDDVIRGGPGDDLVSGEAGHDHLVGGGGETTIYGGPGNDVLIGHRQLDDVELIGSRLLQPGPGNDKCSSGRLMLNCEEVTRGVHALDRVPKTVAQRGCAFDAEYRLVARPPRPAWTDSHEIDAGWSVISPGVPVTLRQRRAAGVLAPPHTPFLSSVSLRVPISGAYKLRLVAGLTRDPGWQSRWDSTVTFDCPYVDAGNDRYVPHGVANTVVLQGVEIDAETISWSQESGPGQVLPASGSSFSVIKPKVSATKPGTYRMKVKATSAMDQASDTMQVHAYNLVPTANAGSDDLGVRSATYRLNGSGSDRNGDPLAYKWTLPSGVSFESGGATSLRPWVRFATSGRYELTLRACDPYSGCDTDRVVFDVSLGDGPQ